MKAKLFACHERGVLRDANRICVGIPYGRAIRKPVKFAFAVDKVHKVEFVSRIVVDEGRCQAGDIVDTGAVVNDPKSLGEWAGREEREARRVTYPECQERAAEEILRGWRGGL